MGIGGNSSQRPPSDNLDRQVLRKPPKESFGLMKGDSDPFS